MIKSQGEIIHPKKSLGQNFLKDGKSLEKIIQAADLSSTDNVLEIGPGTGVLTAELIKSAGKVIAIEKDEKLSAHLLSGLNRRALIVNGDILKVNLPKLIEDNNFHQYKVVANIPYYITGQIIRLLLETKYRPRLMVLLVQKEVAERICAQPGQMSILSASVQYYGSPQLVAIVPKESFHPVPQVDSAIVKITLGRKSIDPDGSKKFFKLVRIGFSSRRKTLLNNLSAGLKKDKKETAFLLETAGLDKNVRSQELGVEDWIRLAKKF